MRMSSMLCFRRSVLRCHISAQLSIQSSLQFVSKLTWPSSKYVLQARFTWESRDKLRGDILAAYQETTFTEVVGFMRACMNLPDQIYKSSLSSLLSSRIISHTKGLLFGSLCKQLWANSRHFVTWWTDGVRSPDLFHLCSHLQSTCHFIWVD